MNLAFKILQTKDRDLLFNHYDWIKDKLTLDKYEVVYEDIQDFNYTPDASIDMVCETIYRRFNRVTEEDCKRLEELGFEGHSLSVSDIVVFAHEENKLHYVDAFGFETVDYKLDYNQL